MILMVATRISQAAAALFALIMLLLAFLFWRDLDAALDSSGHRLDQLGKVLAGRNIGMAVLAVFAILYRDRKVLAVSLGIFAFLGLIDGFIYWYQGYPWVEHATVGLIMLAGLAVLLSHQRRNRDPQASTPATD